MNGGEGSKIQHTTVPRKRMAKVRYSEKREIKSDDRIKEDLWRRKRLNWTFKDGQNQYTEIKEGLQPHPMGQR